MPVSGEPGKEERLRMQIGEEQVADQKFNWSLRLKGVRSPSHPCASTNSFTVGEKGKENDLEILQWKTMKHQN